MAEYMANARFCGDLVRKLTELPGSEQLLPLPDHVLPSHVSVHVYSELSQPTTAVLPIRFIQPFLGTSGSAHPSTSIKEVQIWG